MLFVRVMMFGIEPVYTQYNCLVMKLINWNTKSGFNVSNLLKKKKHI